ncbi:protein FAM151B isoform 1-T1 [Synchiropus picturatus]
MMEADVILRGREPREPVMAHPPETDSDVTLREWLDGVRGHHKGIKLDFKSLEAVAPSAVLLQHVSPESGAPLWMNADVLPGPGAPAVQPLEASAFLAALGKLPAGVVLSLGWTSDWRPGTQNPGYSWEMVQQMEELCRRLEHAVTFPVRAALLPQSLHQLSWLLQQSPRFSLTVWTCPTDDFWLQDLRPFREQVDVTKVYFDLPEEMRTGLVAIRPNMKSQ